MTNINTQEKTVISPLIIKAEKIVSDAKIQADLQMENMEKKAKEASLENSVALLDKVLEDMFTKDEKEKILTKSMKVMQKYE